MSHSRQAGVLQWIAERCEEPAPFALVTVLRADGSTPAKAGSMAVVEAEGAIQGTIGGGMVEAEAQRRGIEAIRIGCPIIFDFALQGAGPAASLPICGGAMRVLVDPTARSHWAAYAQVAGASSRRQRGVLLTTIQHGMPAKVSALWLSEPDIASHLEHPGSAAILQALRKEEAALFSPDPRQPCGEREVLAWPVLPRPVLLIAGGGHVGQAVAQLAGMAGFDLVVIEDREEFCRPELFPDGADIRCQPMPEEIARFPFDADTFVVIVTRGHAHDAAALAACLAQPAAYVGMIGSRRKVALLRADFIGSGRATAEAFDRVFAPIGLDIGAVTVPEIAVSILAQLIAVRRTGRAPRMS